MKQCFAAETVSYVRVWRKALWQLGDENPDQTRICAQLP
jgi:hypothetical protein